MSRSERNNPSARMGRVLDDFDALEGAYMELATKLAEVAPEVFQTCAPKPSSEGVVEEKARRQFTLGKVLAARTRMRVRRIKGRDYDGTRETRFTRSEASAPITEAKLVEAIDEAVDGGQKVKGD